MKTKLLSAVLLSMTSLFSVAQSEYTSPEVSPYDKAKELKAFDASKRIVSLPLYPKMEEYEVQRVINAVKEVINANKKPEVVITSD